MDYTRLKAKSLVDIKKFLQKKNTILSIIEKQKINNIIDDVEKDIVIKSRKLAKSSLFTMAEKYLQIEMKANRLGSYNFGTIINTAIKGRKFIDNHHSNFEEIKNNILNTKKEVKHNNYIRSLK